MIRKLRLISKFITLKTGKQIIAIHILPIISKNNGNYRTKFGQLIEYKMRNIFLEESYTGKTSPIPFSKKKIERISGSTV